LTLLPNSCDLQAQCLLVVGVLVGTTGGAIGDPDAVANGHM
jgi:hypothetical protein